MAPQINPAAFRDGFRSAWDANPTPYTALLILGTLKIMATSLDEQATKVLAPLSVQIAGTRLKDRISGLIDDAQRWRIGQWNEDVPPKEYFTTAIFYRYPNPGVWEDDYGPDNTSKYRGEAWEVATFYNQVAAVGHPLQDAYFGEGIQGWLQKATAQVVVSLANQIGESLELNEAVEKWDSFKSYMATQTEQLTKKATWWIWAGIFLAGGWAWSELQRGRQ